MTQTGSNHGSLPGDELTRYIEQARTEWKNVGLAIAVVQGSDVIFTQGFGARAFDGSERVDPDTLFQVGSTTKAFTTAALAMLVSEGRIHWDDPVIDYLPTFQLQDPWLTRTLTIRDAVTHRSGISAPFYFVLGILDSDEAIRQLRYSTAQAPFRDSFVYDNVLYAVAGRVVEVVSGMSWRDYIKRRLLQPLQMNRSGTSPYEFWERHHVAPVIFGSALRSGATLEDARDRNVAMPHGWDEDGAAVVLPWQCYDNAAAAGSLVSSARDMAKWLLLNLNQGCFEGQQLLGPDTVQELHATQNLHTLHQFPFERATESYAMGWFRAEYRGHVHLEHGGGIIGFPSYMALLPDQQLGIAVLSNGSQEAREQLGVHKLSLHRAIAFWAFDRLLGAPPRDWSQELLSQAQAAQREIQEHERELQQSRLKNTRPTLPFGQCAGTYEDRSKHSGHVYLQLENGRLRLLFAGDGAFAAELEHWHQDLFRLRSTVGVADVLGPQFVAFKLDPAGKVVSMSASGAFDGEFQRLSR